MVLELGFMSGACSLVGLSDLSQAQPCMEYPPTLKQPLVWGNIGDGWHITYNTFIININ